MEVVPTALPEVKVIVPRRFGDPRGFFSETWNRKTFAALGLDLDFVQDNHSANADVGTIRGLHFQIHPFAQAKLVRVTRGAIVDVAVDVRRGSPTYGQWIAEELSAANWRQILVPVGFAHAYCTLEPDTEVVYKVDNYYAADHDRGVLWNDPAIGVRWPVTAEKAVLSDKDRKLPRLADLPDYFVYRAPA